MLVKLTTHCVESLNVLASLGIDFKLFEKFMKKIYEGYRRDVEYHNDVHGADVMQFCYLILKQSKVIEVASLNDLDVFSTVVAAACHDFGHDGYTNMYHVNSVSDRAILFSD